MWMTFHIIVEMKNAPVSIGSKITLVLSGCIGHRPIAFQSQPRKDELITTETIRFATMRTIY